MTVFDQADLLVVDSGISSDTFNKMARARLQESDVDHRIAEAVAYFMGVERPFAWWVGPGSPALNLEDRLHDYGLEAKQYQMGMAMELWDLPPKLERLGDLTVRSVPCAEELTGFAGYLLRAGSRPTQPYVGSTRVLPHCCFKTNVR